jgi:DNA polymerase-3 subunit epsilon
VSEYSSLVNPHQSIPPFISQMTGITYDMVVNAPEPHEILNEVLLKFNDKDVIFCAHNARFDLGFINNALEREESQPLMNPTLCTLKLAKRLINTKQKKNVGALAEYFNIPMVNRHRALGDAIATATFLIELLKIAEKEHEIITIEDLLKFQNKQIKHFKAPSVTYKRVENILNELPEEPGVYRFLDKYDNILYIGKAKILKDRVKSYFSTDTFTSSKIAKMFQLIHNIKWETTETELEALLLESREIKKWKPYYNTVDKKYKSYPFVKLTIQDDFPIIQTCEEVLDDGAEYFGPLRSMSLAEDIVKDVEKKFKIRKCYNNLKPSLDNKACFYFHIEQCLSPCTLETDRETYMEEIEKVKLYLSGLPDGIISQLVNQMEYYSSRLEFEKAENIKRNLVELKRLFSREEKVPTSINKSNMIVLIPASQSDKTVDVFMIQSGMLKFHNTIGRKAPVNQLQSKIHDIYFNSDIMSKYLTKANINEIKIVTNWLFKQNGNSTYIYFDDKSEKDILIELEKCLRNMKFQDNIHNEYSQ